MVKRTLGLLFTRHLSFLTTSPPLPRNRVNQRLINECSVRWLALSLFGYNGSLPFSYTNDPFPSISKLRDAIFTAETVAQWKSPIFLKQVLELTNSFGAIRTVASGMVSERCVGKQT